MSPERIAEIREEWRGQVWGGRTVMELLDEVERYHRLRAVVNDSGDCLPACSSYGHEEDCPRVCMARWLEDQRARIEAADKLAKDADQLCGWIKHTVPEWTREVEKYLRATEADVVAYRKTAPDVGAR